VKRTPDMSRPLLIAHRGASRIAPENTLPAFALALEMGADGIECDVQLSRDGHVVVIHDETLERTTDGRGRVADRTLEELRRLDASFRSPQWPKAHGSKVPIPTLEEVLAFLAPMPKILCIELKPSPQAAELVQATLAAIARFGLQERVILAAFDPFLLRLVRERAPMIRTALLWGAPWTWRSWSPARALALARETQVQWIALHAWLARRWDVTPFEAAGFALAAWTVNRPRLAWRLAERGLAALITDVPDRIREAFS